jgi:diguanylate cyclase (GGDEF)-like protein
MAGGCPPSSGSEPSGVRIILFRPLTEERAAQGPVVRTESRGVTEEGQEADPGRDDGRRAGAWSFAVWLVGAMTAGLLITSAFDYALASEELERQVVNDLTLTTKTQALAFGWATSTAGERQTAQSQASALDSIARADGTLSASLLGVDGRVLLTRRSSSRPIAGISPPSLDAAAARSVAATGGPVTREAGSQLTTYAVVTPHRGPVLAVVRSQDLVQSRLVSLKRRMLPIFFLGILLGVAVFYLTGGRQLAGRYRRALNDSGRDALTGLGNRAAFREEIINTSLDALRAGAVFSVALLDVDHFTRVTSERGHRYGDQLLMTVGHLLRTMPSAYRGFRLGFDGFAVVLQGADASEAHAAIEGVRSEFTALYQGETLSCGVAVFDGGAPDADDLVDRADTALYAAKAHGRDRVVVFGHGGGVGALAQKRSALEAVLAARAVSVVFQPIWDLQDGRILAYEALARPAADSGFEGPGDMFAVAERLGMTRRLDELCTATALAAAGRIPSGTRLFLNLCPYTLADPEFDPAGLAAQVAAAGLAEGTLTVEITENGAVDWVALRHRLDELRRHAIAIALDDVGAGDSGLQVMRRVDADFIKIDRAIIADALERQPARAVLAAILAYARETSSYVIAEGIETEAMLELVRATSVSPKAAQVRGAQGYLLGRPGPDFVDAATSSVPAISPR